VRGRLSYSGVVSTLALVIAVGGGGTAWAMVHHHHHYVITSTAQIKPSVIQHLQGHPGASGAPGAPGAPGAVGATGPAGIPDIVTATSGTQSLTGSPTVVEATAPSTGTFVVLAQVEGDDPAPQPDGGVLCSLIDLTAAPSTDLFTAGGTFPKETTVDALIDVVVQGPVKATKGDTIGVKCTAALLAASNPTSPEASITLTPQL
jgi:hypothetical protein